MKLAELHFANIIFVETEKAVPKVLSVALIELVEMTATLNERNAN